MNLLAVFCYITVTCDTRVAQQPAVVPQRPRTSSAVQTRNVTPPLALNNEPTAAAVTQKPPMSSAAAAAVQRNVTPPSSVALNVARTPRPADDARKTTRETSTYPTRYDYIDVEAVMSNDRIIKVLFNCVMNRGPCTREGLELKKIVPDAIQTECAKCNDRQRKQAGKVLAHLLQYKPQYWKMLVEKFDPNNVYLRKYMADDDDDDDEKDDQLALQKITNDTSKNNNN